MTIPSNAILERAFTFDCEGSRLIGVIHDAVQQSKTGLLTIVAGGPQYRGGCGRQLVELGRHLAANGIPVMRFDHRGLGDSEGPFLGFQHLERDIAAAIDAFKSHAPALEKIILWGGCDAASAALINAYKFPEVTSIVAANPWVESDDLATKVRHKHYLRRLREKSFWLKLVRFEYNISSYLSSGFKRLFSTERNQADSSTRSQTTPDFSNNYITSMLNGLSAFEGTVLFLMSGRSLISRQFDELVSNNNSWRRIYNGNRCTRIDIEEADQTFSSTKAREKLVETALEWVKEQQRT